jgi:hypothetical protein
MAGLFISVLTQYFLSSRTSAAKQAPSRDPAHMPKREAFCSLFFKRISSKTSSLPFALDPGSALAGSFVRDDNQK